MEYHGNKNVDVARKVFEMGLKKHMHNPAFVLHYVRFLMSVNDDNSNSSFYCSSEYSWSNYWLL